jgi:hypothetical protein
MWNNKAIRRILYCISSIAICVCVLIASDAFVYESIRPKEGELLEDILSRDGNERIRFVSIDDIEYIEVIGRIRSTPLTLPSGPPAYIFDDRGYLVTWTSDRQNDRMFRQQWGEMGDEQWVPLDQVLASVKAKRVGEDRDNRQ